MEKEPQEPAATMDQSIECKVKTTRARNKKLARYGILFAVPFNISAFAPTDVTVTFAVGNCCLR